MSVYYPADAAAGITLLALLPGEFDELKDLTAFDGKLYFSAYVHGLGRELWVFDPAAPTAGAVLAADIAPGTGSGRATPDYDYPEDYSLAMTELDGKLYLNARDGVHGYELMAYEPIAGPLLAADINTGAESSFPVHMTVVNDKLYFRADDGPSGAELWIYNPTCSP